MPSPTQTVEPTFTPTQPPLTPTQTPTPTPVPSVTAITAEVIVTVVDESGKGLSNIIIDGTGLDPAPVTGMDGVAKFKLPAETYELTVTNGTVTASRTLTVTDSSAELRIVLSTVNIPDDAVYFNDHAYKIYGYSITWTEAKQKCEELGGHLVTITSQEEQSFIENLNSSNKRLWIGAYRDDSFNWKWVTNEKWFYTNWGEGEPNNSSNVVSDENCVAIWPQTWNDLNNNNISEQSGFICEWDH